MKLATVRFEEQDHVGFAVGDEHLVDLGRAFELAQLGEPPRTMLELIEGGPEMLGRVEQAHRYVQSVTGFAHRIPIAELTWLPPIVRPSKVIGVAINNRALAEAARVYPAEPSFFFKPPSALIGHRQPIEIHPDYGLTHPEAELAVIIGKRCKHLTEADALSAVFGYTIINDVTSVDLKSADTVVYSDPGVRPPIPGFEHGDMQLTYHARSKGTDTFGPIGPWILTADEVKDPNALAIQVYMRDQLVTEDNTGNLMFGVARVLTHLTRYMTLEPGDIVHQGTAARGKYSLRELDLQRFDGLCEIEIAGMGRLENPIRHCE